MKLLLFFTVLIFSVFGFCEALHNLKLLLIFPKRKMQSNMVVILSKDTAEQQMLFVGEQQKWLGTKYADRIIAVYENLPFDTVEACEQLAVKYDIKLVEKGRV